MYHAGVQAITIAPNTNGLPGLRIAEQIVGALITLGLVAAVATLVISGIVWAAGSHGGNPHKASAGRTGVMVALILGFLCGGADLLVTWAANLGSHVS